MAITAPAAPTPHPAGHDDSGAHSPDMIYTTPARRSTRHALDLRRSPPVARRACCAPRRAACPGLRPGDRRRFPDGHGTHLQPTQHIDSYQYFLVRARLYRFRTHRVVPDLGLHEITRPPERISSRPLTHSWPQVWCSGGALAAVRASRRLHGKDVGPYLRFPVRW